MGQRALKTDGNKNPIQGGSKISGVIAVSITAAGFTAITMPAGSYSKEVRITTRDNAAFQLSDVLAGTTYISVPASTVINLRIVANPGEIIGYAKGTTTTTLEVLLTD